MNALRPLRREASLRVSILTRQCAVGAVLFARAVALEAAQGDALQTHPNSASAMSAGTCASACAPPATGIFCDGFSDATLGDGWFVIHGQPRTGPPGCKLELPCNAAGKSEIQSVGRMRFGRLTFTGLYHTAWHQFPGSAIDSYVGWQLFHGASGNCHSAIVIDDGTLGMLSNTNCAPEPTQCYCPIPGWPALASAPHTYELRWTEQAVELWIDEVLRVTTATCNCPITPPMVGMRLDFSCNLDGVLTGEHVLEIGRVDGRGCQHPFRMDTILNDGLESGSLTTCWSSVVTGIR